MKRLSYWVLTGFGVGIWSLFVWIYPVQPQNQPPPEGVGRPGTNGVGYPRCLYCPAPKLPSTPKEKYSVSIVALEVVIRTNGRATDIRIVNGSGSNLDQKAIEAVKRWRFQPALDATGKRVPTVTAITVIFSEDSRHPTKGVGTGT